MRKDILQRIRQLECVHITKTELNMRIHDKFGETKNFTTKMEGIAETGLLSLFGRESPERTCMNILIVDNNVSYLLDGLEIHIVVKMEIIQILKKVY